MREKTLNRVLALIMIPIILYWNAFPIIGYAGEFITPGKAITTGKSFSPGQSISGGQFIIPGKIYEFGTSYDSGKVGSSSGPH